jgi:HEAT repeat protein
MPQKTSSPSAKPAIAVKDTDASTRSAAAKMLGALGGGRNSPSQQEALNRNRELSAGRPKKYTMLYLHESQDWHVVKRIEGDSWEVLSPPYDKNVRKWLRNRKA